MTAPNALPPISTCPKGQEEYVWFSVSSGRRIQYDYRHPNGRLFSCIAKSIEAARAKRDAWISKNNYEATS